MAECDVGDGAGAGEDGEAGAAAACEGGQGVDEVAAGGEVEDEGPHEGVAFLGDHHRRLRPVLRPRRPPARFLPRCFGRGRLRRRGGEPAGGAVAGAVVR